MSAWSDPETLLDLTQDAVAVLDEDGICRRANAAVADVLGFESAELVGTDAFSLAHPEDETRLREAFEAVVAGEVTPDSPIEHRYGTADGDWVWLRTWMHAPAKTDGDGYVVTARDVTAEVESRRRLETIASVSSDVFWMFSADWSELLFVNDAVEGVFDVSTERLTREPTAFLDAVHPDDRPSVERAMERLSAGESALIDYRLGTTDGVTRWIRVPGEPVVEDGEVVAVAGFARDVTAEYRRKRQLSVMDNLLRHTIRNDMNVVDGTAAQIADRVANAPAFDPDVWEAEGTHAREDGACGTRGDPGADDATEAGTEDASLTPSISPDELAAMGEELTEHAATIRRVADDLLTTAEKQRGVIDLLRRGGSPRAVPVAPVVEEALDLVGDDCDGVGEIDVSYRDPRDEAALGTTDRGRIEDEAADGDGSTAMVSVSYPPGATAFTYPELDYAIAELVENAIEHAETTPRVRIDVTETDEDVSISIRDNCPPIPAEERCVITDRWEMNDLRHTGGMGLWLVYWVAKRSDGDLAFDTHPNGNVVTLTVPNAERTAAGETGGGEVGEMGGGEIGDAGGTATPNPPTPEGTRTPAPGREGAVGRDGAASGGGLDGARDGGAETD
ncbi:PAS domain S-box protein [Halorubrum sp. AD140]|uniref:PAS domain-containing sensor histidine kinase n=1 Tax=Halorubrum sp. AD140 TaxID=3050073 RepID=UPI002ACC4B22|nr:PAS domain-containing protein [Halorubrum sp. AD140]MDZ5812224.1 PAS domain S-box protein [Halorubrum sp. AD140]